MKSLAPLIFPDTRLKPEEAARLLSFFPKLYHYLLLPEDGTPTAPPEISHLLEGYAPVDLGGDQERFKRLLLDLKGHENEYLGGYLAALSGFSGDLDETAVWSLIKRLNREGGDDAAGGRQREILWQALLILKLAETLSREEELVASGLAAVEESHARLLAELKGGEESEDEEPFPPGLMATTLPGDFSLNFDRLTRAWAQLFLRDRRRDQIWMMVSPHRESVFLLLDIYESLHGAPADRFLSLPVPEKDGDPAVPQVPALDPGRKAALQGLHDLLWQAATADDEKSLPAIFQGLTRAGGLDLQEKIIPANQAMAPGQSLVFYFLKDLSLQRIVAELCGTSRATGEEMPPVARHGIVALLN